MKLSRGELQGCGLDADRSMPYGAMHRRIVVLLATMAITSLLTTVLCQ